MTGGTEIRKLRRLQHAVERHCGILPTDEPQKYVVLCNAGLATGLREADLITEFSHFGPIDEYVLLSGKSFCIVCYENVESAIKAHNNLHGTTKLTQHGQPLFLSYMASIPKNENKEEVEIPIGLTLYENFVNSEEEDVLLKCIEWDDLETIGEMKNRKVKHYGYEFLYDINNVDVNKPLKQSIPEMCNFLWKKMEEKGHNYESVPDQLTINQYNPGHGIPSHVDTHSAFLSPLIVLSLGGTVVMDFKRMTPNGNYQYYHLPIPSKSLMILDGASRYEWSHGISPKNYDIVNGKVLERSQRTSFTFRWVRRDGNCKCDFPQQCDTFKNSKMQSIDQYASVIEQKHVHEVYEEIASHFSHTRSKIWPCVRKFVEETPAGSILIDVGCGNGKNLHIKDDIISIGLEYSNELAKLAAKSNEKYDTPVVRGDCLRLPYLSECADAVISIAVFHHFVTEERRMNAIGEVIRILRPNGRALISVWAKDQSKGKVKTSYLKQSRKNRKEDVNFSNDDDITELLTDQQGQSIDIELPVHVNRTDFLHKDLLVPWKRKTSNINEKEDNFMRFYHVFDEGELERLCQSFGNILIEESFYEEGNWCIVFRKK